MTAVWKTSAAVWQHQQGVKQPHACEISPMQYQRLSTRARRTYNKKRGAEWADSSAAKARYAALCVAAFDAGEFALDDTGVDPDAIKAVHRAQRQRSEAERAARWEQAQADNALSIDQINKGDRVFVIVGGHYGIVTKVNKKSIRVKIETAYLAERAPMLVHVGGPSVCRLSHHDLKAKVI